MASNVGEQLQPDAGLPEVIELLNELSVTLGRGLATSPSVPLDAPEPSAAIVYSDAEYDALSERLDAPPEPSEQLRRTLAGTPPTDR